MWFGAVGGSRESGVKARGCDGPEGDVCGHLDGETGREGADLFMNIHFECVTFPAAQFVDGEVSFTVKVESHGAPCPEGVAADIEVFVAEVAS